MADKEIMATGRRKTSIAVVKLVKGKGRVFVNGKAARASYDVKVGDIIEINMGQTPLKVKVISVNEIVRKEEATEQYVVIP